MQCRVQLPLDLKASGIGKEGPRPAVAEMTDVKTVILHGRPW